MQKTWDREEVRDHFSCYLQISFSLFLRLIDRCIQPLDLKPTLYIPWPNPFVYRPLIRGSPRLFKSPLYSRALDYWLSKRLPLQSLLFSQFFHFLECLSLKVQQMIFLQLLYLQQVLLSGTFNHTLMQTFSLRQLSMVASRWWVYSSLVAKVQMVPQPVPTF